MSRWSTAVRCRRPAGVALQRGRVVLSPAPAAPAAGTGGVELSPYPGVVDGKQVTAFHVTVPRDGDGTSVRYALRNTTRTTRSARLYAASARRSGSGWSVGDAGSSPYLDFPDRTVSLRPTEVVVASFRVRGTISDKAYGALVVEVANGSVTQRAATLVYLKPGHRVPLPVLLVGAAVLLLLAAGGGVALARRRPATTG
jgi:hypothetical protein